MAHHELDEDDDIVHIWRRDGAQVRWAMRIRMVDGRRPPFVVVEQDTAVADAAWLTTFQAAFDRPVKTRVGGTDDEGCWDGFVTLQPGVAGHASAVAWGSGPTWCRGRGPGEGS